MTSIARVPGTQTPASNNKALKALLALSGLTTGSANLALLDGAIGYGIGGPLYSLIGAIAVVAPINGLDDAFTSHKETSEALADGESAYTSSVFEGRKAYSLAWKENGAIYYFSIMHDANGNPIEESALVLCRVQVERDFKITLEDGTKKTILPKGKIMFKGVNAEYFKKIKG